MRHTITKHYPKYHPERLAFSEPPGKVLLDNGIIIRIKLKKLPNGDSKTIFEIPGALKIETGVYHFPEAFNTLDTYRKREYYNVYTDESGNLPYIEAEIIPIRNTERKKCAHLVGSGNGVRKNKILQHYLEDTFKMPLEIPANTEEAAFGATAFVSRNLKNKITG